MILIGAYNHAEEIIKIIEPLNLIYVKKDGKDEAFIQSYMERDKFMKFG